MKPPASVFAFVLVLVLGCLPVLACVMMDACSSPAVSPSASAGVWQVTVWQYSYPDNHPCVMVVRQPDKHYLIQVLNDHEETVMQEDLDFASDAEMNRFVEQVCKKREQN